MKRSLYFLFLLMASCLSFNGCTESAEKNQKAKYIFLFIGDGMGYTQVSLTESYLSYKEGKLGGARLSFTGFPVLGTCETYSADYSVTCSSAAGTAIACGQKTNNNFIGVDTDGMPLESVAYVLKEEGYKVGIMSNVQINHATPGAFFAHQDDRNKYYEIGAEVPESGFDFFAGSGFHMPRGERGEDREPLDSYIERNGYEVCYGMEEYSRQKDSTDKMVFVQASGRKEDTDFYVSNGKEEQDIDLDAMVRLALDFLGDEEPFFIMCEGGEIDWAAHENKTMDTVHQILDFEKAVNVALEFYDSHPEETLILVTADHGTGGAALGQGPDWRPENFRWDLLEAQWNESQGKVSLPTGDNQALNARAQIGWTTNNHTGEPVPVYAKGKGAEKFSGRIDNTDIKGKILGE